MVAFLRVSAVERGMHEDAVSPRGKPERAWPPGGRRRERIWRLGCSSVAPSVREWRGRGRYAGAHARSNAREAWRRSATVGLRTLEPNSVGRIPRGVACGVRYAGGAAAAVTTWRIGDDADERVWGSCRTSARWLREAMRSSSSRACDSSLRSPRSARPVARPRAVSSPCARLRWRSWPRGMAGAVLVVRWRRKGGFGSRAAFRRWRDT